MKPSTQALIKKRKKSLCFYFKVENHTASIPNKILRNKKHLSELIAELTKQAILQG